MNVLGRASLNEHNGKNKYIRKNILRLSVIFTHVDVNMDILETTTILPSTLIVLVARCPVYQW